VKATPAEYRSVADEEISRRLLLLAEELGAGVVLGYLSLADEVRIDDFLAGACEAGKKVLLPRIGSEGMEFCPWRPSSILAPDGKGVLAPRGPRAAGEGFSKRFIVVPGRAFDREGGRLGRGGGYYDRFLAQTANESRVTVGVAYECQIMDERIPLEAHDARMDFVVTERGGGRSRR
jgi:5-formyltetrahydrofolate cyclo-ligase